MRRACRIASLFVLAMVIALVLGAAGSRGALAPAAWAAPVPTVAVLYFDYDGSSEEMGHLRKGLNQMLVTDLVGIAGIKVVERVRLEEVMTELELGRTRKIDSASAARVGKLLGAHYLVMGGYFDFQGSLQVSVKVVHVETGTVVAGVRERRKAEDFWDLQQALSAALGAVMREKIAVAPGSGAPERPATRPSRSKTGRKATGTATAKSEASRGATQGASTKTGGMGSPRALHARVAARYGRALDAMDRGDVKVARAELEAVVASQPDFELAAVDLASLAK